MLLPGWTASPSSGRRSRSWMKPALSSFFTTLQLSGSSRLFTSSSSRTTGSGASFFFCPTEISRSILFFSFRISNVACPLISQGLGPERFALTLSQLLDVELGLELFHETEKIAENSEKRSFFRTRSYRANAFTFSGRYNYVARLRSNYDYARTTQFEERRNILYLISATEDSCLTPLHSITLGPRLSRSA